MSKESTSAPRRQWRAPTRWPVVAALLAAASCSVAPRQPPGAPPSPKSITREAPGGDAHDPHRAALLRLLSEPLGARRDKDNQLIVPLVDHKNQKRVRYWAVDHFVGFRYGADYHAMNVVFVHDLPEGVDADSETCIRRAEKWGRPQLQSFDVKLKRMETREARWRDQDIVVRTVDGHVNFGLKRRRFTAAWAAYPAYPRACLVFSIAIPWGEHGDLAHHVRDRWVEEAVPKIRPLTRVRPYRK